MSSKRNGILKEAGVYGFGTLAAQVVSAIRGLIIAGMLGPSSYGLWKSLQVGLDYLGYTHMGILHGMSRKIPLARAHNDEEAIRAARKAGFAVALGSSLLVGLLVLVWTRDYESPLRVLWIGIAGLLVLGQLIRYLAMRCQADGRLEILSLAELTWAIVSLVAMYLLVPKFGVLGVLLGLGAGFSTAVIIAWSRGVFPTISDFTEREMSGTYPKILRELLTTGFPFMFVDGLFVVWQRIDRLVLVFLFGAESQELGWYGLATMVAMFAIQVPQILMRVLFRRTVHRFAETELEGSSNTVDRQKFVELPVLACVGVTPLMYGFGIASSFLAIDLFLPQYSSSNLSITLLLLACFWSATGISVRNVYTATNRQWRLAVIYLLSISITVLSILIGESVGSLGIEAGALGMLLGSIFFGVVAVLDTCFITHFSFRQALRLISRTFLMFIVFSCWVWVLYQPGSLRESWGLLNRFFWDFGTCLLILGPSTALATRRLWGGK